MRGPKRKPRIIVDPCLTCPRVDLICEECPHHRDRDSWDDPRDVYRDNSQDE